jgi:hypothetical protein
MGCIRPCPRSISRFCPMGSAKRNPAPGTNVQSCGVRGISELLCDLPNRSQGSAGIQQASAAGTSGPRCGCGSVARAYEFP